MWHVLSFEAWFSPFRRAAVGRIEGRVLHCTLSRAFVFQCPPCVAYKIITCVWHVENFFWVSPAPKQCLLEHLLNCCLPTVIGLGHVIGRAQSIEFSKGPTTQGSSH